MNKFLIALAAMAACAAYAAPAADQVATPAAAPASAAAGGDCVRVVVHQVQVNGKLVDVKKRERIPDCKPRAATRLWD